MAPMQRAMSAYGQAAETLAPAQADRAALRRRDPAHQGGPPRDRFAARVNERYIALEKATAIVEALHGCLDYERGGEIARQSRSALHLRRPSPAARQFDRRHLDLRRGGRAVGRAARVLGADRRGRIGAGRPPEPGDRAAAGPRRRAGHCGHDLRQSGPAPESSPSRPRERFLDRTAGCSRSAGFLYQQPESCDRRPGRRRRPRGRLRGVLRACVSDNHEPRA